MCGVTEPQKGNAEEAEERVEVGLEKGLEKGGGFGGHTRRA